VSKLLIKKAVFLVQSWGGNSNRDDEGGGDSEEAAGRYPEEAAGRYPEEAAGRYPEEGAAGRYPHETPQGGSTRGGDVSMTECSADSGFGSAPRLQSIFYMMTQRILGRIPTPAPFARHPAPWGGGGEKTWPRGPSPPPLQMQSHFPIPAAPNNNGAADSKPPKSQVAVFYSHERIKQGPG
jgi:hypothetical protein